MDNKKNFFLLVGGFISLLFYLFIAILVYLLVKSSNNNVHYSMKKDAVVVVSLTQNPKQKKEKKQIVKKIQPAVKKELAPVKEEIDPFDDVETESIKYTKNRVEKQAPVVNENFLRKLQTKKVVTLDNHVVTQHQPLKIEKVDFNASLEDISRDLPGIQDEYRVKLQAILTKAWQNTSDIQGNYMAVIHVTISPSGRFEYSVKHYARYEPFDQELNIFLDYQTHKTFDRPPKAQAVSLNVNFISRKN